MKRGEIWWASMVEPKGSEPGFRRPVVIVSSNEFNQSQINTIICAALTSNLYLAGAPGNFKLSKTGTGLNKESVVNISQLITLDKSFLSQRIGKLAPRHIYALKEGLGLVLGI